MAEATCTECGAAIPANRKTCSSRCRQSRSRRIRRAKATGGPAPAPRVDPALQDEVLKDELRPVAREALTADVRSAIHKLVGLFPKAAEAIERDLGSNDPILRQKAYQTLFKHTVGQGALVADGADGEAGGLKVYFNLPRPDSPQPSAEVVEPAPLAMGDPSDADPETRQCLVCGNDKPEALFVGASDRCTACHEELQAKAQSILEGGSDGDGRV